MALVSKPRGLCAQIEHDASYRRVKRSECALGIFLLASCEMKLVRRMPRSQRPAT